ncbi:YozE family protein [Staphylococcus pseudintermedius]|nr:YozE family protein [Staphylococcus pseudintermedius]
MTFYEYMKKFKTDDNRLSDIFEEIEADKNFPVLSSDIEHIRKYINYVSTRSERVCQGYYFGIPKEFILKALYSYDRLRDLI